MNPEDMDLQQLTEEIRREIGRRADQDHATTESLMPVRVKAARREEGLREDVAWGLVIVTGLTLVVLFIAYLL